MIADCGLQIAGFVIGCAVSVVLLTYMGTSRRKQREYYCTLPWDSIEIKKMGFFQKSKKG